MISAMKSFRMASKTTNDNGTILAIGWPVLIDGIHYRTMFMP